MSRTVTRAPRASETRGSPLRAGRWCGFRGKRGPLSVMLATFLLLALVASGSAGARTPAPLNARIAAETNKPPKVTKQPVSVTVEEGHAATFSSTASGVPTPTVQWELSTNAGSTWTPLEGATAGTLTIASAKTSETGNEFRAVYQNIAGEATTKTVTLTVQKAQR
jgi:Immunoglobulin I-set domain